MVPDTEADLVALLQTGDLREGDNVDLKRELASGDARSRSLANDLASFAILGGTIIVGVTDHPATAVPTSLLACGSGTSR